MAFKRRKYSASSSPGSCAPHGGTFTYEGLGQSDRDIYHTSHLTQSTMVATQKIAEENPSVPSAQRNAINEGIMRLDNYVERMATQTAMGMEDGDLLWSLIGSLLPDADANVRKVQILYEGEIQRLAGEMSERPTPKPFHNTGLGRLAPELRELIFTNLVATPPLYNGRDFRATPGSMSSRSPISLTTFVDLKTSCFAILQTCRQIYIEAFPLFYANESYYVSNAQDLVTMVKRKGCLRVESRLFRLDTIVSLCLKNLLNLNVRLSPQDIDPSLGRMHNWTRERLQAVRVTALDSQLFFVDLHEMKSLRKICICMRAGQEPHYLRFLFNIDGLRRGVIEFEDNFHWTMRSQSPRADNRKYQYVGFSRSIHPLGITFELLGRHNLQKQKEKTVVDSLASDLREGDERWVEVDVGARTYEEFSQYSDKKKQRYPDATLLRPCPGSESNQDMPAEEVIDPLKDDRLGRTTDQLQGLVAGQEGRKQSQSEPNQGSGLPRMQRDGQGNSLTTDFGANQERSYLQDPADGDDHDVRTLADRLLHSLKI